MTREIHLRPAAEADFAFALDLYLRTMEPYTAELMVWDESKQIASFECQWKASAVRIIVRGGRDVGWLQASEEPSGVFLQQLFLLPERQREGIGSKILTRLLDEWAPRGPVTLTVLRNNPARRLYERFGFVVVEESGAKLRMQWQPSERG